MMEKSDIYQLVNEYLKDTDCFIVDIRVSSTGKITVLFDKKTGGLMVEDCVKLSKYIESKFDREQEDYELQVSSPGLEMPFLVHEQYLKNQGRQVEVTDNEGLKYSGVLKNVTRGGFEIESEVRIKGKGKVMQKTDISFNFDQIKSVRAIIVFNKRMVSSDGDN